jgi:SRSO17 transposase
MISRALEAGVPFAWFTADEAYGQAKWQQTWLEEHGVSYVIAIRRSDTLPMPAGEQRADSLIAAVPARAWQKISAGAGRTARASTTGHASRCGPAGNAAAGTGCWPAGH